MSENGQNKKREKENTNRSNRKTSNETTDIQGIEAKIETVNKGYLPVFMDLDDEKKKHGVKTPRMKNEGLVVVDIQSKGKSMQHAEDAENGEVTGIKTDEFVNKKGATSSVVMGEDARKREDAVRDRNAEYLDRRNKAMRTRREDNGSTRVKKSKGSSLQKRLLKEKRQARKKWYSSSSESELEKSEESSEYETAPEEAELVSGSEKEREAIKEHYDIKGIDTEKVESEGHFQVYMDQGEKKRKLGVNSKRIYGSKNSSLHVDIRESPASAGGRAKGLRTEKINTKGKVDITLRSPSVLHKRRSPQPKMHTGKKWPLVESETETSESSEATDSSEEETDIHKEKEELVGLDVGKREEAKIGDLSVDIVSGWADKIGARFAGDASLKDLKVSLSDQSVPNLQF